MQPADTDTYLCRVADHMQILNAIFSTGAAVALIATLFLDNTIP